MQVSEQDGQANPVAESRAAIEALESSVPEREIAFNWVDPLGQPWEAKFIQAELGMFPSQEFVTRLTEIIESFTEGEMGMKIGELFRGDIQMPDSFDPDTVNDVVEENMALVKAFIQLVKVVPSFELDVMCLSLGIPRKQWAHAQAQMQEPPSRGGLTVSEGFDILIWFVKQNGELLSETFTGKARELVDAFRLHVLKQNPNQETQESSEPSLSTAVEPEPEETAFQDSPGGTPSSTSLQAIPASD